LIANRGPEAQGITHLIDEWTKGVVIEGSQVPGARTEPVKQLEAKGQGTWRKQPSMRKVVFSRKPIWLAYERRVLGHPLKQTDHTDNQTADAAADVDGENVSSAPSSSSTAMTKEDAIKDLEVLAR
jgi:hypothetical protein